MGVPDYYQPIMPYLVIEDAEQFIIFINAVFDAEEKLVVRRDDGSVMHGEYCLNGGTILFGQASEAWPKFPAPMYLVTEDVERLYVLGLANGSTGNQEPADRGYGLSAGFKDKWGNQWWLNWPTHGST